MRTFPVENIESRAGDGRAFASKIECCSCGAVAYYSKPKGKNPMAIEQHFRHQGWFVGNGPRVDKCPSCQKSRKPELKVVANMEPAKAEPPREMSREDRRIIFAKIDELYMDDKSGYSPPWTDSAVARDLGVPRAWVTTVRDELFSPEGSNSDFDEFIAKAAPVITDLKNLHNSVRVQLEEARSIAAKVDELERMSRKIEKEIGR